MLRPFRQVDVFADVAYAGNPVAVVLDGDGLDDDTMRDVARWTNLSETTFVLPPTATDADYRVRIFTPTTELPFAGHPTLGTCHAWLAHGGTPQRRDAIVQQCAAGLVTLRRTEAGWRSPPRRCCGRDRSTTSSPTSSSVPWASTRRGPRRRVGGQRSRLDRRAAGLRRRGAGRPTPVRRSRRRARRSAPGGLAARHRSARLLPQGRRDWSRTR